MVIPAKLSPGDTVAIAAPARKVSSDQLSPAITLLKNWGLNPVLGEHVFSNAHNYLSGSDGERSADFQQFLNDADVKAVFSARGGYGCTRIVDSLTFDRLVEHPKWIVGFSDVTAIHLALSAHNIASIHGTMPIFFGQKEAIESVESLRKILFGETTAPEIDWAADENNRAGSTIGPVIGGNLSLVLESMGTRAEPDTSGKILVIEEIDEYYYKLDRMMMQLKRSGKLRSLAGLIIGHMTDLKDSDLPFGETVSEIVHRNVGDAGFPVAFGFPSGHDNPNVAWVHGLEAKLEVSSGGASLRYRCPDKGPM